MKKILALPMAVVMVLEDNTIPNPRQNTLVGAWLGKEQGE